MDTMGLQVDEAEPGDLEATSEQEGFLGQKCSGKF